MEIDIRRLMKLGIIAALGFWTCMSLDSISLSKYETGKSKFNELEVYAASEHYGKCWTNAVEVIKIGCHEFTEETHAKMALAYLNCFLEMQGRQGYVCAESDPVHTCTEQLSDSDRSNYATFFTHTHSICYFLQSQVWHEKTQKTIQRLSLSSEQVADQLEESSKLQQTVIERQNQSLKNQETILDKAHNLSKIINTSSENIHEMLSDFQKTSVEQRTLINNLFDRVAQIQTLVTGELSTLYSVVYYISAIFVSYLLTSASRTSGARLWLFGTMMLSMGIEWLLVFYVFKRTGDSGTFQAQADKEIFHYQVIWYLRKVTSLLGACILLYKAYSYKDIHELNHQQLQDLRTQFSHFSKVLKELVEKTPHKEADESQEQNTLNETQVPIMTTPMQETDRCSQEGLHTPTASPTKSGGHVVPIPVEHIPDTPVSQKSGKHHESHSEPSSSTSRKSRSRSSMERELKALKASSPYGAKRELVLNWTKSGYYRSPGAAIEEEELLQKIHDLPDEDKLATVYPGIRVRDVDFPDDTTDISLRSTKRYSLRERKTTKKSTPS